jgi:hypothetical protein
MVVPLSAQDKTTRTVGIADDWSHHHLVFSNPGTAEQAMQNGTYEEWLRIQSDPRYLMQQVKRYSPPPVVGESGSSVATERSATETESAGQEIRFEGVRPLVSKRESFQKDWSMDLGSGGTIGTDQYPSKWSFSTTQAFCDSDTTPDYVVNSTGPAGTGAVAATGSITLGNNPNGWTGTSSVTVGATTYTFVTALTAVNQVLLYTASGSASTNRTRTAENLEAVINANSSECYSGTPNCVFTGQTANASATATAAGSTVTLTAITPGTAGNTIPLSRINGNPGNIAVTAFSGGVNGPASIIAYDNLYSQCSGLHPLVYWQYATTGTAGPLSPTVSEDGTQVVFVQNGASGANLVLLKWTKNASLVQIGSTAAASYRSCVLPCMTAIPLSGAPTVTYSTPFYDYLNDVVYVGDDSGMLHKFQNIFNSGTPAEVSTNWPVNIDAAALLGPTDPLTGPVFDNTSGNVLVFITGTVDGNGTELAHVSAAGGTVTVSAQLGNGAGEGPVDAPLVDSSAGTVYGFLADGRAGTDATVVQLTTTFISGATATSVNIGIDNAAGFGYDGTFDNTYYSGASPTGNLYACGYAAASTIPTLYRIPVTNSSMGTPVALPAIDTTAGEACSPVAEFFNSPTDRIFLGVTSGGSATGCAGGCAMNFVVTEWQASTAYSVGQQILDSNNNIQVVKTAGTSKTGAHPTWSTTGGATTTDGTVTWVDQEALAPSAYATWVASHSYSLGNEILDSNGNVQVVTTAGTSKSGTHPTWSTTVGATTVDGTVTWTEVGIPASYALASASGTSGMIIDNSVSGTGYSQVYYSTLANQACAGNNGAGSTGQGTGGCAVQASQSALQ